MTPTANTPDALDLDAFEDVQSATCILKNPATGAPTRATILLAGPEHPARQKIIMDRTRRIRATVRKTGKLDITDPLEDRDEETQYLAVCTLGWQGLTRAGADLPYSVEAAAALYADPRRQWLRAQVREALDQVELFIGSSAAL